MRQTTIEKGRGFMYGMVNRAVEEMVLIHYDDATWERIKAEAGVAEEEFMSHEAYPDEMTYSLVAAAAQCLDLPAEQILEGFGEHWVLVTAQNGYGAMMDAGGRSLPEFLRNLPGFHARVSLIFPSLKPPVFRVSDVTEHSLHLHYYSHRPGLGPFVVGLLRGLAARFATEVTIESVARREEGADHDEFLVAWSPVSVP